MKKEILKLAGVKSESAFYKKFPTEEAFMKVHGKAFKKAAMGASMVNKQLHQLTDFSNPPIAEGGITSPYNPSISSFGKTKPSLNTESPRALGDLTGPTDFGMRNATDTSKMFGNFQSGQAIGKGLDKGVGKIAGKGAGAAGYLQAGMDVIEGVSMIKGQNDAVKSAKQEALLTGVQADAAASQRRQPMKNYYTRPEDMMVQPEQLSPSYGVGTNILSAKNGTEIQNTYAPNDLYDDLGYEPLNDSERVKAFYHGGRIPMAASGFSTSINQGGFGDFMTEQGGGEALDKIGNMFINRGRGPSAGSKIGGGVGAAAGSFFLGPVGGTIGKFAGQAIGSLIDQSGRNIEKYNKQSDSNIAGMMGNYIPQQFGNVMEDGGWVSNDWQPQTITKFGEYDVKDLLQPPNDADMLRAGGNLKSYTPPSERAMQTYAMGGELQVHRGEAEPISNNPYLPDGGETVMFRGPSHENGGMPISYGQSPVEVEGGEPAVKLRDGGGEDNLVVFGNLKINKEGAKMLGNPKLKNKKFKNYVNDLSKIEAKQNKIIDKSVDTLDNLDVKTSFDKLTMSALEANLLGGNMKLKNIADKKQDAAALQSAINDTAEEYGVVADDLAQGKIKMDKKAKEAKAQGGTKLKLSDDALRRIVEDQDYIDSKKINYSYGVETADQNPIVSNTDYGKSFIDSIMNKQRGGLAIAPYLPGVMGEESIVSASPLPRTVQDIIKEASVSSDKKKDKKKFPWKEIGKEAIPTINQILPFLRPSDVEDLDPRQLLGEFYALSNNQVEPVQAQTFQPRLQTSYDISLQDQLNEITAQTREAQRLVGNNPEALAAIYAQATMAKNKVIGEQMRINQGLDADVYRSNINALNQAQLQNLQMYDTQQQRQEAAKSATKATTQEALNSISAKYAQNKLENKQLATMENLYNYRFDKSGRAINMNPLAQFDTEVTGGSTNSTAPAGYEFETILKKKKPATTKESRNGSIVKAIKNL
jgi:hypothetical protein